MIASIGSFYKWFGCGGKGRGGKEEGVVEDGRYLSIFLIKEKDLEESFGGNGGMEGMVNFKEILVERDVEGERERTSRGWGLC